MEEAQYFSLLICVLYVKKGMRKYMKRDPAIEMARIIACLMVIGVHTCLSTSINGIYEFYRVVIACFIADGVAIFWLISGCFLFNKSSYKKLVLHTVKNIIIPMCIFSIFSFYLSDWLIGGTTLKESIIHTKEEYLSILKGILVWTNPVNYGGHLWYLYAYLLVILIFPILKAFVTYLDSDIRYIKCFMLISFIFLILNDISGNKLAQFSHHSINALVPASLYTIWGHIIYKYRNHFVNKKYAISFGVIFIGLNIIRASIQFRRYNAVEFNDSILYWFSSIGIVCSISVIIFCLSMIKENKKNNSIIYKLASGTFLVYLVHPLVIAIIQKYDYQNKLYEYCQRHIVMGWMSDVIYTFIIIGIVFILSFIISGIIIKIKSLFCYLKGKN